MERAPNVSVPMARRISKHLDSGIQPTISGRRVVLHDVILVRASGQEHRQRKNYVASQQRGELLWTSVIGTALQRSNAKEIAYMGLTFLAIAT